MFDLFQLEDFLDPPTREAVLAGARAAAGAAATVSGRRDEGRLEVVSRVRHSMHLDVADAIRDLVDRRLSDIKAALIERFGVELSGHEPPQFLRYETGGYFVAHQDGNTPLTRDRTLHRRVSIVIFLNTQTPEPPADDDTSGGDSAGSDTASGYSGGELVFHAPYPNADTRQAVVGAAGSLLAFRSETTHEVMMVTGGERYTIATWFRTD